jgi:ABC-type dipeptide/oligopeptide/nickel transport system permease subunit
VVTSRSDLEDKTLVRAILRFSGNLLGLVFGTIGALVVFLATNWLLIKGGDPVGPHLSLLSQFFIGYSVTFVGSLIGAAYAFVSGYLAGLIVAYVYNGVVRLKGN